MSAWYIYQSRAANTIDRAMLVLVNGSASTVGISRVVMGLAGTSGGDNAGRYDFTLERISFPIFNAEPSTAPLKIPVGPWHPFPGGLVYPSLETVTGTVEVFARFTLVGGHPSVQGVGLSQALGCLNFGGNSYATVFSAVDGITQPLRIAPGQVGGVFFRANAVATGQTFAVGMKLEI